MLPSFIRIQDLADILIMTFLLYQLYSWFRKTRAMQVLLGLGVVTLIYFATRFLDLYMTSWILQELGTVLIILIIVVFQAEIRQALYRFSLLRNFFDPREKEQHSHFQQISDTLFMLAGRRIGALLVFKRMDSLADLMLNGVRLDCEISPQILETIFYSGTPLHDGAALIRDGRIALASCHLPLSSNPDLPQYLGTRHRAALGLSERTDAIVVAVSEERGEVSLADAGEFLKLGSPAALVAALEQRVSPVNEKTVLTVWQKLFSNLLPKMALLLIVTAFWALITFRQGQITTVTTPVRLQGLADELILVRSSPEELEVQLKSLSSLTPTPAKLDISANVDLSGIREGQTVVRIKNSDFSLPSGMAVSSVNPSSIKVFAEKKVRKTVPVRVDLRGAPGPGMRGYDVVSDPATVVVEGPAGQISRVESIATEEIDAGRLVRGKEYRKNLLPPSKMVTLLRDEPVLIKAVPRRNKR
ncbi:MAG: TIGR00159 family protein [Desulfuromonadales bacterium]|nr:TIGR00159 family protein [Desulfuromonadales bacterium]